MGVEALEQIARWRQGTPNGSMESPKTDEQRQMVLFPDVRINPVDPSTGERET